MIHWTAQPIKRLDQFPAGPHNLPSDMSMIVSFTPLVIKLDLSSQTSVGPYNEGSPVSLRTLRVFMACCFELAANCIKFFSTTWFLYVDAKGVVSWVRRVRGLFLNLLHHLLEVIIQNHE